MQCFSAMMSPGKEREGGREGERERERERERSNRGRGSERSKSEQMKVIKEQEKKTKEMR